MARNRRPSQATTQSTPHTGPGLSTGALARGEGLLQPPAVGHKRGTIVLSDARRHTYMVAVQGMGTIPMGRIRQMPGEFTVLDHGTPVRVDFSLGTPYIDGILPLETRAPSRSEEEDTPTITGAPSYGGNDTAHDRNFGVSARGAGEPSDLMPGDQAIQGPDGANLAALRGKIAQLFGSEMAQIKAFGDNDHLLIVAGVLRLLTWMGESEYTNDVGKTSFKWRGGSDQLTQTGADEERYTIRLDVGHTGGVIKLEVTTPDGQPVFRFHVDPAGRGELFFAGGLEQHVGNSNGQTHPVRFHGGRHTEIEGAELTRVSGESTHRFESVRTVETSSDDNITAGQDHNRTINRHEVVSVGGKRSETIHGPVSIKVTDEDYKVEVSDHMFYVKTGSGDIKFETTGVFKIKISGNDKIELGDNPSSHCTKYEELKTELDKFVDDTNSKFSSGASHTHETVSAAGPGTATPSTSLSSSWGQSFSASWDNAKSTLVKLN